MCLVDATARVASLRRRPGAGPPGPQRPAHGDARGPVLRFGAEVKRVDCRLHRKVVDYKRPCTCPRPAGNTLPLQHASPLSAHEYISTELYFPRQRLSTSLISLTHRLDPHDWGKATGGSSGGKPLHIPLIARFSFRQILISLLRPTGGREKSLPPEGGAEQNQ